MNEQTITYRVYYNGTDFLGIASLELPNIQYMSETLSGSGIAGEIDSPTIGMTQSMQLKMTFKSADKAVYDVLNHDTTPLFECYASVQKLDETTGIRSDIPMVVRVVGHVKSFNLGTWETGKLTDNEVELEVVRLEVSQDDSEILCIDKMSMIYRVNGDDKLASTRSHIGLAY